MAAQVMTEEVGVRFGLGNGVLFLLTGVMIASRLTGAYGVALLLVATAALAVTLDRRHALGLGLAGWAFATGFAVHTLGVLTFAPHDLLRLAVFLLFATAISPVRVGMSAAVDSLRRRMGGGAAGAGRSGARMVPGSLSVRRRAAGYALAVVGVAVSAAGLLPLRGRLDLASDALLFLLLVVTAAILGGLGPALVAGALGAVLLNFFFTQPYRTLRIHEASDVVTVVVFAVVALMVSWVVDLAARRASAVREAAELEAGNRLRTALLAAVGHDLRTPLATAKAVVSGLRSRDVVLSDDDRRELLETADDALDRLTGLVENLLDLSRLQAGALPVRTRPVPVDDVVARALDDLGVEPRAVVVDLPEHLPDVVVDPGLLERVVVNLVANAQRYAAVPPLLTADAVEARVELRVVDTGPGIPIADRNRVFVPFQRLGDSSTTGLGLGLALSRGLVEAMAGSLGLEETPGGGLTAVVSLPATTAAESQARVPS
jgi:two-component system sensor histidine kinase KdpD